jgi:hypothetical protein
MSQCASEWQRVLPQPPQPATVGQPRFFRGISPGGF